MRVPAAFNWKSVAAAIGLIVLPWTWLLLPSFGGLGEMTAIAAPLLFVGVFVLHGVAFVMFKQRILVIVSALVWLTSATVMILSPRIPIDYESPRNPVTIVASNLHYREEGARDVVARGADVVVISEGTPAIERVLEQSYPYQLRSGRRGNRFGQFVASRYPLRRRALPAPLKQAVVAEVLAPTPFLLVGVHLPRAGIAGVPYLGANVTFAGQRPPVNAVVQITKSSRLPVVVAGDLNVSDRTAAYRRLVAHRRDAMRAGWAHGTFREFPWSLMSLRIDHVLIDRTWCADNARRFHPSGTDHDAVEATIGPCP